MARSPIQPFAGQFVLPRLERVIAGPGTVDRLAAELDRYGCRRAVVVTGATLGRSALVGRVRGALGDRCRAVFSGVRQHVPSGTVQALLAAVREHDADCLVSFGGGSPIDTAKAAVHALLAPRDGSASGRGECLLHVALPTTLSAGEFTDVAGITDEATRIKHAVFDARLVPRTVIADAELTLDTPDWLWAASGMRALDHAVESLYSSRHHPISDALAVRAIEMLVEHLPGSIPGAADERLARRGECQMAAWLAVFGLTNAGFGLSHVLGHQIGPRWNVAHGVTSSIMLPFAMRFMADAAPERFSSIARAFHVPFDGGSPKAAALECADRVAAFIARFDLPTRLRDVGVPREEMTAIAAHVCDVMERAKVVGRAVTPDDIEAVLDAAY